MGDMRHGATIPHPLNPVYLTEGLAMAAEMEDLPESEEEEVVEYDGEDDELYAVMGGSKPGASLGSVLSGDRDDDTPYHKIDFMHDVPLRLSVEIGQAEKSVKEILQLNVGAVVEFTKVVGEPMDITISGRLMARGEIVVVNERYGVRISEVTRPDESGQLTKND